MKIITAIIAITISAGAIADTESNRLPWGDYKSPYSREGQRSLDNQYGTDRNSSARKRAERSNQAIYEENEGYRSRWNEQEKSRKKTTLNKPKCYYRCK